MEIIDPFGGKKPTKYKSGNEPKKGDKIAISLVGTVFDFGGDHLAVHIDVPANGHLNITASEVDPVA